MKLMKFTLVFLVFISEINAQIKIDSTNYCSFYNMKAHYPNSNIKTTYLDKVSIANIVYAEMENLGFKWLTKFAIVKIDSTKFVSSICYSEKSRVGFLFEATTGMVPQQKNRYIVSLYKVDTGNDYSEKIYSLNGESDFIKIKELPKNLHILKMENYWYQESSDPKISKELVSKEFIYELLKQDIRNFCKGKI